MSLARLVITAVKLEGRTRSAVAREYGISRYGGGLEYFVHGWAAGPPVQLGALERGRPPPWAPDSVTG
jgi:hypothetical protein